jgi:methylated-DNA-[protein]-cysteine S-methyltransferase
MTVRVDTVSVRRWTTTPSPVGELLLGSDGGALTELLFERHRDGTDPMIERVRSGERDDDDPVLRRAVTQLGEYFARDRREFDLPLAPVGTEFRRRVWTALLEIPYGATASYGDIVRRLGLPMGTARAVGLANGANPISIVIPCHRVIGANGSLIGYGGGLERKRLLLDLEQESDHLF